VIKNFRGGQPIAFQLLSCTVTHADKKLFNNNKLAQIWGECCYISGQKVPNWRWLAVDSGSCPH
jgi:hypothetical protein